MNLRSFAALSLTLALLTPVLLTATAVEAPAPADGAGVWTRLPHAPTGPYVSLANLVKSLKPADVVAQPKVEPYPNAQGLDVAGNDHANWLRNVHGPGFGEVVVFDGIMTLTHTPVTIDTNIVITGSVTYDHSTLTFTTPEAGHRTITVARGGSLTITNSLVKNDNGDRLDYGLIQGKGGLTLSNNRFEQMVVFAQEDLEYAAEPAQTISGNHFTNALYGVLTDRDNLTVQRNAFYANNYGLRVIDAVPSTQNTPPPDLKTSNPLVLENTFEMNEYGIQIYTDQNTANGEPVGTYRNNLVRANLVGVQCYSAGWVDPNDPEVVRHPIIEDSNIFTNYGDAVNNLRGITIIVPFVGPVGVSDSSCSLDGNYYGSDSLFLSSADDNTNVQATPVSLPNNPALPKPIVSITNTQTWNSSNPPPAINGPVVVESPGQLTIQNINFSPEYLVGAKKGGRITVDNIVATNGNGFVLRNDNDVVRNSEIYGTRLFDPVTVWRNNATVNDNVIQGSGRDRNVGLGFYAGQFTEDFTWSPDALRNDISNLAFGLVTFTTTVTLTENDFHHIGELVTTYPLGGLLNGAVGVVLATIDSSNNEFHDLTQAYTSQLMTLSSDGDDFDGGLTAFNSLQLNTLTFNDAIVANMEFGIIGVLETSLTITDSNITYNGYGVYSTLVNPTISTTNLYNNYLYALYPYTTEVAGQHPTSTITCTTCWVPSDESWFQGLGSLVAMTQALGPNGVRSPGWAASAREVRSGTFDLPSGTLAGPVIARSGGEVRVTDVDIDMGGRFPIGAKGGGQSGGTTGKLTISGSRFENGGFIAMNSTASSVRNSLFRDFASGADLFNMAHQGSTVECNDINLAGGYPGRQMDMKPGASAAVYRRNKFVESGEVDTGIGFLGDNYHTGTATTFSQNSMIQGTSGRGAVWFLMNGTNTANDNNFLSNRGATPTGIWSSVANRTTPVSIVAPSLQATNNYWGHDSGPLVRHVTTTLNPGQGLRLQQGSPAPAQPGPTPTWSPYRTADVALDPCIGWRYTPSGPLETQTLSFSSDLTFDPSGPDIATYAWNFNGEGSSSAASPTFRFLDGGSKTVTLTVTTVGGKSASLAKTISVAHTAPAAGFTQVVVNEITDVVFTDTSTHPNSPQDAPPTGWTYAWTFGDGQNSNQRNPSHRYADGGSYNVQLTVTDNDGQTNSKAGSISVPHVGPVADFSFTGTLETQTYQFTDASTHPNAPNDGIASRSWSCTDGFTSTAQNPSHKFADGGAYSCTLTVTDNDGLSSSITKAVGVAHVGPSAAFTSGTANEVQDLAFTDQSTHPNSPQDAPPTGWTYAWTFGDGGTSSQRNPSRNYADGGTYTVQLTVTDNDGLSSSASHDVSIAHVGPVAAFSFAPPNPDPGEAVAFTDLSTHPNAPVDGIASWAWDFADGATSTEQNPSHAFADMGNFDVQLCVADNDLLSSCITIRVPVGNNPPVAAFTYSPSNPTDLDTVQFTDASTDSDGTVVSWAWDFGDGATSDERNPTHLFADNGLYTVTLTVEDNLGATTSLAQLIEVTNVPPTAGFTYGPGNPQVNDVIQFQDTSFDPDGAIVSWAWDFGDGATSAIANPTHSYPEGGDYVVTLTVSDDDGVVVTTQQTVHVCETQLNLDALLGGTSGPLLELCLRLEI